MADKLVGLSEEQLKKAITALLKFVGRQKEESSSLFDEDELLYLVRDACTPSPAALRSASPANAGRGAWWQTGYADGSLTEHHRPLWHQLGLGDCGRDAAGRPPPGYRAHIQNKTWELLAQVIALKKVPQQPRKDKPIRL